MDENKPVCRTTEDLIATLKSAVAGEIIPVTPELHELLSRTGMQVPKPATGSRFTREVIDDIFSYHAPRADQLPKYEKIREGARLFAYTLVENTPAGPDQTTAIHKLRELVMTANQAVALDGKY